jgi:hypothetical protein
MKHWSSEEIHRRDGFSMVTKKGEPAFGSDLGSYWRLFQADMSVENAGARGSSPASSNFSAAKRKATAVMYSAISAAEGNR